MRQAQTILGAAGASAEDDEEGGTVELVLYYTPPWPSSMKARRNLEKILGGYAPDAVHLTLRDLAEHPDLAESRRRRVLAHAHQEVAGGAGLDAGRPIGRHRR